MEEKVQLIRKHFDVIVRNINACELLPCLMTIDTIPDVCSTIFTTHGKDPPAAARILVNQLIESKNSDWYDIFMKALEDKGYETVFRYLKGCQDVKNHKIFETLMNLFYASLCDEVDAVQLLPYLLQTGCIGKEDAQRIESENRNNGQFHATLLLLLGIEKKSEDWFAGLIYALKKTDHEELIERMIPKLSLIEGYHEIRNAVDDFIRLQEHRGMDNTKQNERYEDIKMDIDLDKQDNLMDVDSENPMKRPAPLGKSTSKKGPVEHEEENSIETSQKQPLVSGMENTVPKQFSADHTQQKVYAKSPELNISADKFKRGNSDSTPGAKYKIESPKVAVVVPLPERLQVPESKASPSGSNLRLNVFDTSPSNLTTSSISCSTSQFSSASSQSNTIASSVSTSSSIEEPVSHRSTRSQRSHEIQHHGQGNENDLMGENLPTLVPNMSPVRQSSAPSDELSLRSYQLELAQNALKGENSVIVAPTGAGKTHVALYISKNHLEHSDPASEPKIVFMVPTTTLVNQQHQQYRKYLNNYQSVGLTGEMGPENSMKIWLRSNDIFIITPQILLNALQTKEIDSLDVFSLLIFDECHHTAKNHPYNAIMSCYFEEKAKNEHVILPQIVGLTASVGVGKNNNVPQAVDHILKLCANLNSKICTVQEERGELQRYVNIPDEESYEVPGRKDDRFHKEISELMRKVEHKVKQTAENSGDRDAQSLAIKLQPPSEKGCDPYTNWVSNLRKPVAKIYDQKIRRVFVACMNHLQTYNESLLLNADCRTKDALKFINSKFGEFKDAVPYHDDTDTWLDAIFRAKEPHLRVISEDSGHRNPKLERVKKLLLEHYRKNYDLRAIVFCKTREMTLALENWMKEDDFLKCLNAQKFTGANAPADKLGMTQQKQEDIIKYFKDGRVKVIIATTVAEEGLDIRKCSLVIRYQHVTNETARIQAKGRSRATEATYAVVSDSKSQVKEQINREREKLMYEAINEIHRRSPTEVQQKMDQFQRDEQVKRKTKGIQQIMRDAIRKGNQNTDEDVELRCMKCDDFACFSSDIKRMNDMRMVVSTDFEFRKEEHPKPQTIDNFTKTGKIFCTKCKYDWGITAIYNSIEYPVIKINSFVLCLPNGQRESVKKWKDVTAFEVNPLTSEDQELMQQNILTS